MVIAYQKSKKPTREEIGIPCVYTEQVGARFDKTYLSIPFVRVTAYTHFSVISSWRYKIILKKGDVESIELKKGLISEGLQINHRLMGIPDITVWSRHTAKLKSELAKSLL